MAIQKRAVNCPRLCYDRKQSKIHKFPMGKDARYMTIYDGFMFPLEKNILQKIRKEYIPRARGQVLEIGMGTGVNLPLYRESRVQGITGLDVKIHPKLWQKRDARHQFVTGVAEALPFPDGAFDTVVATLVLCSVGDAAQSLSEIYRVLRPGGQFIFIEHVLPAEDKWARAFHQVNKPWRALSKGCNLDRETHKLIEKQFPRTAIRRAGKGVFCYGVAVKEPQA